jgi:hypothetical protein
VVHLSYASVSGEAGLAAMRETMRAVAEPTVDTSGQADAGALSRIHLDPPVPVPARGMGRWLSAASADLIVSAFDAASIGEPDGLNMVEMRHVASNSAAPEGAMTQVPGPFLLHAVAAAGTDTSRVAADHTLQRVQHAAAAADIGRSAPSFREGQPDAAGAYAPEDLHRLQAIARKLDPNQILTFARGPARP